MSRFNAILLSSLVAWVSPAFSQEDIDPATGLARSTVVRPLVDPAAPPATPARPQAPQAGPLPPAQPPAPGPKRPHIALILPTASSMLGKLSDAVRQGFMAAAEVAGKDAPPVVVTATENEAGAALDACRAAQATGALIVVGGLTRDGATSLAASDCPRQPVLLLNEPRGDLLPTVYTTSLSLDQEARQAALHAVNEGFKSAIVIHTPGPLSRRVQEAFEREWARAAGEVRRFVYTGTPEEAAALREKLHSITRADVIFLALDYTEARDLRPYLGATLPVYATSMSVNPRAEALVNLDLQGLRYGEMPWFAQPDHPAVMVYPQPKTPMSLEQERLYAFGIDAFRLAMQVLKADAGKAPLDGVTGRIVLEPDHQFARTPLPAEIDGGKIIPLRPTQ